MIDNLAYLKQHLKTQIKVSNKLDSKWVYILKTEAEKCLELAEEHKNDGERVCEEVPHGTPNSF